MHFSAQRWAFFRLKMHRMCWQVEQNVNDKMTIDMKVRRKNDVDGCVGKKVTRKWYRYDAHVKQQRTKSFLPSCVIRMALLWQGIKKYTKLFHAETTNKSFYFIYEYFRQTSSHCAWAHLLSEAGNLGFQMKGRWGKGFCRNARSPIHNFQHSFFASPAP